MGVSERLLPPKSILIIGMSILFIYDMIIYQHGYASLRVYRGPGLLAFTLCCIAYSLRIWRRNGIACDEILFLPDTIYAEKLLSLQQQQQEQQEKEQQQQNKDKNKKNKN